MSKIEKHHIIPVGLTVYHIAWHLEHIWELPAINPLSCKRHKKYHAKHNKRLINKAKAFYEKGEYL